MIENSQERPDGGCLLSFPFLSFLSPTPPTAGFYRFPPIPPIFDRLSPRTLDIILLSSFFFSFKLDF